ncbi:hypothetical protein [Tsukamurella sp. NPDC003166]|uniref:hypothetical protein n=1 Tax=Tsukamurella sp. NPDC003166 TaxID=3154444 RepID=UPI0033A61853
MDMGMDLEAAGALEFELHLGAAQWAEYEHPRCGTYRCTAADWYPAVRGLLDDRASPDADPDDDYFLTMSVVGPASAGDGGAAVDVGRWRVPFVQVLSKAGHGFIAEFGVQGADGLNERNLQLWRRHVSPQELALHVGDEHADDATCAYMTHSLRVALCLFRSFVERRDLSRHFELLTSWPVEARDTRLC